MGLNILLFIHMGCDLEQIWISTLTSSSLQTLQSPACHGSYDSYAFRVFELPAWHQKKHSGIQAMLSATLEQSQVRLVFVSGLAMCKLIQYPVPAWAQPWHFHWCGKFSHLCRIYQGTYEQSLFIIDFLPGSLACRSWQHRVIFLFSFAYFFFFWEVKMITGTA